MYNKIAPIILNSGKTPGASTVFISQPDAQKEKLAGKAFLLAEIGGRKTDAEKIIKFLINELEDNYYDDKLLLIGKIDGLKVENVFEATIGKINHDLEEFLSEHKIKLNTSATSITIGAIYENKLHFSSFGKNRSLLIYRRQDGYEIINVENQATTPADKESNGKDKEQSLKKSVLFSSVINGEVPLSSYFIFASESLPEYLSGREIVEIVTKLPPIVAAEQMRNVLSKINSYVPFLGILIKNTTDSSGQEIKEALEIPASAQNSISSLNYTEQKTESMLATAGIINWEKANKSIKRFFKKLKPKRVVNKRDQLLKEIESDDIKKTTSTASSKEKSGKTNIFNMPGGNNFLKPQKISFKKGSKYAVIGFKKIGFLLSQIIKPSFWSNLFKDTKTWLKNLNKKNLLLFTVLIIIVVGFAINLQITKIKKEREKTWENFQILVEEIERKEVLIDSHLLYDNEDGAARVLADAQALIEALPRDKDFQIEAYENLSNKLKTLEEKTKKINKVSDLKEIRDLTELNINELIVASNKLYGAASSVIYNLNLENDDNTPIALEDGVDLRGGKFDGQNTVYYRDQDRIYRLNTNTDLISSANLSNYNEAENYAGFALYNQRIYLLARGVNNLFVYPANLSTRNTWLREEADLSNALDLFIDGNIYFLNRDGQVLKYRIGQAESYNNKPLDPPTNSAHKILGDDKQLYVLDGNNKRIAMIAKEDGHLMGQYYFETLDRIDDFALDAEARLIYILSNNKIYTWQL